MFRQKVLENIDKCEQERHSYQLRDTLAWLDLKGQDRKQQDSLDLISQARERDTCEWILRDDRIYAWLDSEDKRSYFWLHGKPGSGERSSRKAESSL